METLSLQSQPSSSKHSNMVRYHYCLGDPSWSDIAASRVLPESFEARGFAVSLEVFLGTLVVLSEMRGGGWCRSDFL